MICVCDIGGTKSRVAFSKDVRNLAEDPIIFDTPATFMRGVDAITNAINTIVSKNSEKLEAVVIAIAGVLSKDKNIIVRSPHLPGWEKEPLKAELEKRLQTKVVIENDAALAGLGEAHHGAGRGYKIVAYVTMSTGVGGARICEGAIDQTSVGFEPGWQIIDWKNNLNLEYFASGYSLQKRYKAEPKEVAKTVAWQEVEQAVAVGLHNMSVLWSPDIFVLGGSQTKDLNIENLEMKLKSLMKIFPEVPKIVKNELPKDNVALMGGLVLVRR